MATKLSPDIHVLASLLQRCNEATMGMTHSHIRGALQGTLADYDYVHDVNGDDKSGDVVYSKSGKMQRAGYKIRKGEGDAFKATIDHDNAVDVTPRTVYESADEAVASETARKSSGTDGSATTREALNSDTHTAGQTSGASRPSGEQQASGVNRETLHNSTPDGARFVESVGLADIRLKESAGGNPLLKIISAGRGSSGYYTEALLKRDGPEIFKRGTLGFINHATPAEEAARPEGDWSKIGWVTTGNAYWDEAGKDGPALYAPVMLNNKYAEEIKQLAPHTGASIRASGQYAEAKGNGLTKCIAESKIAPDGKPGLIGKLTHADSIDIVTKAGRDGKLLLESATEGENEMDKSEVLALIKEAIAPKEAEIKALREMLTATKAPSLIRPLLKNVRLPEAAKEKIAAELSLSVPMTEAGAVDEAKLTALVEARAKDWLLTLTDCGLNVNPAAFGSDMSEADVTADIKDFETDRARVAEKLADIFVGEKNPDNKVSEAARLAIVKGRAA